MRVAVHGRLVALVASVFLIGTAAPVVTTTTAAAAPAAVTAPQVWPTPQHQQSRPDGFPVPATAALITGEGTDQPALRVVRDVLEDAGVKRFVTARADKPLPRAALRVYVGGPSENSASAGALHDLGLQGPDGLKPEGYVLGIGRDADRHPVVALSGRDQDGTFYAAQSLRQLVVPHVGGSWLPGVAIRDWPKSPLRGVFEVFYGIPWSAEDRLDQMDFFAATKQNAYIYSPKDDPYLRAKWREPYPADELATLKRLVDRAREDHVDFTYALSPGLSVCYSSTQDEQALNDKFQSLWDIGVRSFAIPIDDVNYTSWNCPEDEALFGTGGTAAGNAHAYLLNRVQKDFIDTHPGADRLQMAPSEYKNLNDTPYRTALRKELDPRVIVMWTGVTTVTATITAAHAQQAEELFGHDILIADNYPVNDYASDRLLLGPYTGREPGVTDHAVGVAVNPMVQSQPSKIAEFGSANYLWNSEAYDADATWLAGLKFLAGPAWRSLKVFAENNYSSILHAGESPVLTPLIERYWSSLDSDGRDLPRHARALWEYFGQMASTPQRLEKGMDNAAFVAQSKPWLDKLGLYGEAGRTAEKMLAAQRAGDESKARKERLALESLRSRLDEITVIECPLGQCRPVKPAVAPGVMEPFLDRAVDANDKWLEPHGGLNAATTTN
ncbi:beta-N-acetylglucosaminidase domain-containing protein [Streptomyces griseorubiginosus]|uniref:beta-N-acetylglucosaminidase domain-containing protein n=1 Tax=Streptomyces griseorubiginosus TaxID=67304 RepID=UPI0036AFB308